MEHLQQGADALVHGNGFSAQIKVNITPPADFDFELDGVEQVVKRAQTIHARGFERATALTIRPKETAQFVSDAQAHIVIDLRPVAGPGETVELQRFKIGGLGEFTPLFLHPQPGGLVLQAGQVEQLAAGQSRVITDIVREITADEDDAAAAGAPVRDTPRSVLVYVDQSSSMEAAGAGGRMDAAAKFLAEFLSKLEIELTVSGSSTAAAPRRVASSAEALQAISTLAPRPEVGWPRSLHAALQDYDRVVVISDDVPAEAEDPRVTLINLGHLPERFDGVEFGPRIQSSVETENHAELKRLSEYLKDRLYFTAAAEGAQA